MDKLLSLFDDFDLAKILPDLQKVFADIRTWAGLLVLAGPLVLVGVGLYYMFLTPREANHRTGFRTPFGMGSVSAWRFTQRIAGLVYTVLGVILLVWMLIWKAGWSGLDIIPYVTKAVTALIIQGVLVALAWLGLNIVPGVFFKWSGEPRRELPERKPALPRQRKPRREQAVENPPEENPADETIVWKDPITDLPLDDTPTEEKSE